MFQVFRPHNQQRQVSEIYNKRIRVYFATLYMQIANKLDKNIIVAFGSSNPLQAANCCHKSRLVADEDELKCVAKGKQISLLLK